MSTGEARCRSGDHLGGRLARRQRRGEAVAFARDGLDHARLFRVGFDLFPEPSHHHVDAAVERDIAPADDGVEQKIAAQNPAGPPHELAQQGEFTARKRDRLAGFAIKGAGVEVENERREGKRSAPSLFGALVGVP